MGISKEGGGQANLELSNCWETQKVLVWRGERGSLSSSVSVSPCVTLTPLVIHKAEMVALSQEMGLSNAPHLAATERIQICVGLESREKTRAPIHSNGRLLLLSREEPLYPSPSLPSTSPWSF